MSNFDNIDISGIEFSGQRGVYLEPSLLKNKPANAVETTPDYLNEYYRGFLNNVVEQINRSSEERYELENLIKTFCIMANRLNKTDIDKIIKTTKEFGAFDQRGYDKIIQEFIEKYNYKSFYGPLEEIISKNIKLKNIYNSIDEFFQSAMLDLFSFLEEYYDSDFSTLCKSLLNDHNIDFAKSKIKTMETLDDKPFKLGDIKDKYKCKPFLKLSTIGKITSIMTEYSEIYYILSSENNQETNAELMNKTTTLIANFIINTRNLVNEFENYENIKITRDSDEQKQVIEVYVVRDSK